MVLAVACRWLGLLEGALVACGLLLASRCISSAQARRAIDLSVVFSIVAAFGLSEAIKASGLTENLGQLISTHADNNPFGFLTSVYIITLITTLLMSNNAAALLIFPLAIASAQHMGIDPKPIAMTITMAASACFATPIGYQTNLMVMGPGGYRFTDYLKLGLPITLAHGILSVLLIPKIWPFSAVF
jgi:di/tricarboxylate transporter